MTTFISILGLLIATQTSPPSQLDGRDVKHKRVVVHSKSLYLQGSYDPNRGAQVIRANIDNPAKIERINFLASESERISSLMRISGTDIYLSSIHDSGGGQIVGGIEKFSLNDIVDAGAGFLTPSYYKLPAGTRSPLKQVILTEPLNKALFLATKRADRTMTPEQIRLRIPAKLRLWLDLAIGADGFFYLYILEEEKLTVWKRDKLSIEPSEPWQKHFTIEGIAPEPFSVTSDGDLTYISSVSGKVYRLSGGNLNKVADSFTPLPGATAVTENEGRTVLFIDDLDAGERWSVLMDQSFNAQAKARHLKSGALDVVELPEYLANALRQVLQSESTAKQVP
jgi:hypothetical protein